MRQLWAQKFFIEGDVCDHIIAAGLHFLKGYSWLATRCWEMNIPRYPLMPKIHMLFHVVHTMRMQRARVGYFENAMTMACASDEDFIGKVCELTRKVSPRQRIHRCMQRYLSQVFLLWHRGGAS